MKYVLIVVIGLFGVTSVYGQDDDATQAELDQRCEDARQVALAPLKEEIFQECLAKGKEEDLCRSQVDDYNGARPGQAPRFYNLPECEEAHDFRKSQGR